MTTSTEIHPEAAQRMADELKLLQQHLPIQHRVVHTGDSVYQAGENFGSFYVVNSGFYKVVKLSTDGREQVVALHFKGDWLGLDGIASGRYSCDAVALDTGEVWAIRYDTLVMACAAQPALLKVLHEAMSREIGRDRDSMLSLCTLPADARVAEFLRCWTDALAQRGLRTDRRCARCRPTHASPSSCAAGPTRSYSAACAPTTSRCACRAPRSAIISA